MGPKRRTLGGLREEQLGLTRRSPEVYESPFEFYQKEQKQRKKERNKEKSKQKICKFKQFFIPLHSLLRDKANGDPLAQLVEHNTFNVGVLGSSPKRITKHTFKQFNKEDFTSVKSSFYCKNGNKNKTNEKVIMAHPINLGD